MQASHSEATGQEVMLDPDNLKNFRPVSNLSFISRLIQRAVASQLQHHMFEHGLGEEMPSTSRAHHSCENCIA